MEVFLFKLLAQLPIDYGPLPKVGTDPNTNVFVTILNIIFGILASLSFLTVVYGGFKYVISRGEPDKIGKAKDTILYSVIGLVISLSAFGIVNVLLKVLFK